MVKTYVLDLPIAGIYVDEAAGMLFGLDVNADEQIAVKTEVTNQLIGFCQLNHLRKSQCR